MKTHVLLLFVLLGALAGKPQLPKPDPKTPHPRRPYLPHPGTCCVPLVRP